MANVNEILLPRRGKKSVMETQSKASIILAKGEFFVECPDSGVGTGPIKIKIGDGVTAYSSLPYALGDNSNDIITFTDSTESNITALIGRISSGTSLGNLISFLKRGIILLNNSIGTINAKLTNLTATNAITEVKVVNALPPDASSHPTTVYLILSE